MNPIKNPHDALIKHVFSQVEHAGSFLRCVLPPAIAERMDWSTLRLEPGSFVDDELRDYHTDLLFSAAMNGRRALIYFLFEHQSQVERLMALRLLRYMMNGWTSFVAKEPKTVVLPAILPVVLHHSEHGWTGSAAFEDLYDVDPGALGLIAEHVPRFRFFLDDISVVSDVELRGRMMTALGRLVLFCLRYSRSALELFGRLDGWSGLVREIMAMPNGRLALEAVWRYMLNVAKPNQREGVKQMLGQMKDDVVPGQILSLADLLWEEGRQKGIEKGIEKGERNVLERLLRAKFKTLPAEALQALNNATIVELEAMTERILTAQTLAEVFGR